jgi:sugar phosphate isomerase/epimerase
MRSLKGRLDLCAVNTATLGHREPIELIVDRVARAGFGYITPWRREIDEERPYVAARQIRDAGLKVFGYCRTTYFTADTAEGRRDAVQSNIRALEVAAELGAQTLVAVVGGLPPNGSDLTAAREQILEGLAELRPTIERTGVTVSLEPLHPFYAADRSALNTISQALAWCRRLDPQGEGRYGVAVDAYHVWWDPDLPRSVREAGDRIFAFHVCDWMRQTQDPLLDRGMMGDGVIDLPGLRRLVESAGYAGPVEVEIFSQANWWKRDPDEVLAVCADRLQRYC